MSKYKYITNARILECDVRVERGFMLTVNLTVGFSGGEQGFGGYCLGGMTNTTCAANRHEEQKNLLAEWVAGVLGAAEAESLQSCIGKVIRVGKDDEMFGEILAIGHAIDDFWFEPKSNYLFGGAKAKAHNTQE